MLLYCQHHPLVPTTPSIHLVIELFQRGQKDHVENTYTCIYDIYGSLLQAVNTILQHQNYPKHQNNVIAPFQGFLLFPTSPPRMHHVAYFFPFSHHFVYLYKYMYNYYYWKTSYSLTCIQLPYWEVNASFRLHQNARFSAYKTAITAVQSSYRTGCSMYSYNFCFHPVHVR